VPRNSMSFLSSKCNSSDVNFESTAVKTLPTCRVGRSSRKVVYLLGKTLELRISGFNQVSVKRSTWEDKENLLVYKLVSLLSKPLVFGKNAVGKSRERSVRLI